MKSTFKVCLLALITALLVCSCSQNKNNTKEAAEKGILHVGNGFEPQDLDPDVVTGIPEQRIISALFEGLVSENPKTLMPEPAVAQSWTISPDKCVYTFDLRKDAKWSNGTEVTAEDFVFAYKRILSPALGSQNAYLLYCLKNAEKYNKGEIKDFSEVGVKAIGKDKLVLTLSKPVPYFLSLITHMSWFPVPQKTIEKFGTMTQRGTVWTLPGNLVSNGAFMLKSWEVNKSIKVVRNPYYWDAKSVKLNGIDFMPISDPQTEERTYQAGQLQITYTIPSSRIDYYTKNNPGIMHITPYLATFYIVFNVNKIPFNNEKVREAFSLAIDRHSLAKYVIKGGKIPADSFTPPDTAGYSANSKLPFDPTLAKKDLATAGYPDGKGFPTVELMYNTSDRNRQTAEAIQNMLQQNLGVKVTLINKEWKMYLDSFRSRDFYFATASWTGDFNDPLTFLGMWASDNGNNRAGWKDSKYDRILKEAENANTQKERYEYFQEAESYLMKEAPIVPLYYMTSMALVSPSVKGWYPNVLDHHPYKSISLVEEK